MMDAARAQTPLRNFEAAAFAEQHVFGGNAHLIEDKFGVPERRMLIAIDGEGPLDGHALRIHRHQYHRLLLVRRRGWVALSHNDRDFAARRHGASDPPFAAVDDVMV